MLEDDLWGSRREASARPRLRDGAPGAEGRAPAVVVPAPAPGTVNTFRPHGKAGAGKEVRRRSLRQPGL